MPYRLVDRFTEPEMEAWVLRTEYGPHLWEWLGGVGVGAIIGATLGWFLL